MLIQAPAYIEEQHNTIYLFNGNFLDYLKNIGIFIYAYNCITSFHYVFEQVDNKTTKRIDKITIRTIGILWIIYMPIGIIAYLSFGQSIKITQLFPNRPS